MSWSAESLDVIDDVDLRQWLLRHGASRETVDCALIRAVVYDLGFAYEDGDPRRPACEAGTALRGLLRSFFTYRGSLMWRMNAGMGDVVFLPFYELLVKRGVEVRFFHRVEDVRVGRGLVDEIEIDVQMHVADGTPPEDYVAPAAGRAGRRSRGRPAGGPGPDVWPSAPPPLPDGRTRGPARAAKPIAPSAYESWYTARDVTKVATKVLKRGTDFDLVVFGLPISCVPNVAPQLIARSPRWQRAVDRVRTVPTQALQLWLDRPAVAARPTSSPGSWPAGSSSPSTRGRTCPSSSPRNRVPGSATVAYFCSVLADAKPPGRGQADAMARRAGLARGRPGACGSSTATSGRCGRTRSTR